ncbi:hypothetical protein ICN48_07300 [Polynucleobacter sp. JS-Safj-400b-B2]|uniref:LPD7 domain-containing protein n=1 Tax=Polynucleobacter sp. JS-Safj-400b-B2 TaxID=2576921 RepID=UPI001C0B94D5|nr:LPD7 domain-containing protein [Polynucleobacter sp. JS-Safj-400b-B2]MBU3626038.1 hypothetical protein [Polynucleobacter sp. JS-Safj-400b-B2]
MATYNHLQAEYGQFIKDRLISSLDRLAKVAGQSSGDDAAQMAAFAMKSRNVVNEDLDGQISVLRQVHTRLLAYDPDWQHGGPGLEIQSFLLEVVDSLEIAQEKAIASSPEQSPNTPKVEIPTEVTAQLNILNELHATLFEVDEKAGGIADLYPVYLDLGTEIEHLKSLAPDQLNEQDIGEFLLDRLNIYGSILKEHLPNETYQSYANRIIPNSEQLPPENNLNALKSTKPIDVILEAQSVPDLVKKRFLRGGQGDYFFKDRDHDLAFSDVGPRLKTATNDPQVIESMVAMALTKGWTTLKVKGSTEFKAQVWLAAQMVGLAVEGYRPTAKDYALLRHARESLQKNEIEGVFTRENTPELSKEAVAVSGVASQGAVGIDGTTNKILEKHEPINPFAGVLLSHGSAPFEFDKRPGAKNNYYAQLRLADGKEKYHWGLGLRKAIESSNAHIGEEVVLAKVGAKAVEVEEPVWNERNQLVGSKPITANRNDWKVERISQSQAIDSKSHAQTQDPSAPKLIISQRLIAYSTLDASTAMTQFPELTQVYALRKVLLDQAKDQYPKPEEFSKISTAIEKRLSDELAKGNLPAPNIPAERQFVQVVGVQNSTTPDTGEILSSLQFKDQAGQVQSIEAAKLGGLELSDLKAGDAIELRNTGTPNKPSWQIIKQDVSVLLHGVASSEWARSLGANEAQAKTVGAQASAILQKKVDIGQVVSPPRIKDAPNKPVDVSIPLEPERKRAKAPEVAR